MPADTYQGPERRLESRDPFDHVERAEELVLRALESFGPAPTLLEAYQELVKVRYHAGRAPAGAVLVDFSGLVAGKEG